MCSLGINKWLKKVIKEISRTFTGTWVKSSSIDRYKNNISLDQLLLQDNFQEAKKQREN